MGELKYYKYTGENQPNDKKSSFRIIAPNHYRQIHTAKKFDEWLEESKYKYSGNNFIFRGVPEAKYKLYASAQRLWWQRDFIRANTDDQGDIMKYDPYYNFLQKLLQNARSWNNRLLENFYKNLGTELNDFALFSLMQHYGLPSPLLDFTSDFKIGLYFAFAYTNIEYHEDEIDNYLSLYIIDLEANKESLAVPTEEMNLEQIYNQRKLFVFSEIQQINSSTPEVVRYKTNTNFNIVNQKGLFIFNFHPWLPIERNGAKFQAHPWLKEIICIDFHKSIKEHALELLRKENIIKDFLFADFNQFKSFVLNSTLENFSL